MTEKAGPGIHAGAGRFLFFYMLLIGQARIDFLREAPRYTCWYAAPWRRPKDLACTTVGLASVPGGHPLCMASGAFGRADAVVQSATSMQVLPAWKSAFGNICHFEGAPH
jgi:hypothetical protein